MTLEAQLAEVVVIVNVIDRAPSGERFASTRVLRYDLDLSDVELHDMQEVQGTPVEDAIEAFTDGIGELKNVVHIEKLKAAE